jgi:hypothetical protein
MNINSTILSTYISKLSMQPTFGPMSAKNSSSDSAHQPGRVGRDLMALELLQCDRRVVEQELDSA